MIIKKINIISFGGIKNKEISFNDGLNIVYGENEAGKSTIQAFIKIWLYGFSTYKGKDYKLNERLKYTPNTGGSMNGEIYLEFESKEYIIRRTFGKSKKEDTSIIINTITGEEINYISKDEPGKYFLNINRATFINTLFIGQLGVGVKKDKEEEIIDKLSNSIGSEEGQVSFDIAILKIDKYKKVLSNVRKNGKLDFLNKKYSTLLSERYEAYKLSEHNLENEENLIKLNEEKKNINSEIINLDIYKKYLKKSKLQKEYEEIAQYFKKKQELKNKEISIKNSLTFNDEIINYRFVKEIEEEYSKYLSLLNLFNKEENNLREKYERIKSLKEPLNKYGYIDELPEDILIILDRLKIKNEVLKEKIDINQAIENEISFLEFKKKEAQQLIGKAFYIKDFREEIEVILKEYEDKLRELKYLIEGNTQVRTNNRVFYVSLGGISILSIAFGIISNSKILSVSLYIIFIISLMFLFANIYINRSGKVTNKKVNLIKSNISKIEKELDYYCEKLEINDYAELFKKLKLYNDYLKLDEKINDKIKEKLTQRELLSLDKALIEYDEVNDEINKYLSVSSVNDLIGLINEVKKYNEASKSFVSLEIEWNNLKVNLNKTKEQLLDREKKLRASLSTIGFESINLLEISDILEELEEKLILRDDINKSLASVEEAYSALTKGKNIELIKNELKDIIKINFNYSYESEEEIDDTIKSKNLRLVEVEKEIKDIENEINNRFNGKRSIPSIEEEIKEVEYDLKIYEKQLKASNITKELLSEAYEEIRSSFGPILNKNVITSFKDFTDGKYKDVMVSDNYEMRVKDENTIMQSDILSNGANDQLYLSLRLAFIEMIFKNKDISIYLDDAFVQYDDNRIEKTIKYLANEKFKQCIIFTCQRREENIVRKNSLNHKYIKLKV